MEKRESNWHKVSPVLKARVGDGGGVDLLLSRLPKVVMHVSVDTTSATVMDGTAALVLRCVDKLDATLLRKTLDYLITPGKGDEEGDEDVFVFPPSLV